MKLYLNLATIGLLAALAMASSAQTNQTSPPCCVPEKAAKAALPDTSLYQTSALWKTDSNQDIKLSALAGRPQIVTMFFSTCQFACPILVHDLKKIDEALPSELRSKVGFALVSFDSERDTPPTLAKFRSSRALPQQWKLLTGKPDDILELALLLGVKFKETSPGQFAHSNLITLLDAKGQIAYQQNGLNQDPSELIKALTSLFAAN
jgi:protein SCO1/2